MRTLTHAELFLAVYLNAKAAIVDGAAPAVILAHLRQLGELAVSAADLRDCVALSDMALVHSREARGAA